jgi:hypothetical protein
MIANRKTLVALLVVLSGAWGPFSLTAQQLVNGDFEGAFDPVNPPDGGKAQIDGQVAQGWRDESAWGEVSIAYGRDDTIKHGGAAAQKMEVRSIGKGAPQLVQQLAFKVGSIYRFTVWVKAANPGRASLILRQSGPPYATYASTEIALSTDWTQVAVTGTASAGDNGLVMFIPEQPGTYWIDDATFEDVSNGGGAVQVSGTHDPVQLIDGDFAGPYQPYVKSPADVGVVEGDLAAGWEDNSAWGQVSVLYGKDETLTAGGKASQRIEVRSIQKGAVQFCQRVSLKAGRIYRFSMRLRSSIFARADVELRQSGPPYTIYGQTSASISPEWRKFEVYAPVTQDVVALALLIPSEPATYWVDDAKIEDVTDSAGVDGTASKGNLWSNGSFEAGLAEGWAITVAGYDNTAAAAATEYREFKPTIDPTTAVDGKASVTIQLAPATGALFSSPQVKPEFGRTYTASFSIKSDSPQTASVGLAGTTATEEVQIGPAWKRFAISGAALLGSNLQLEVRAIDKGGSPRQVWFDGAMLEEGKMASPAYVAPFPVELALTMDRAGSIVFDGEAASFKLQTAGELPPGSKLRWTVEDLSGKVKELVAVPLPASSLRIEPDANTPRGMFKIRAQVVDAQGKSLSGETRKIFSRLPHPRELTPQQAEDSYFGAHVELQPGKLAIARATGQRWTRLHDISNITEWPIVEPQSGAWNWNDEGLKSAQAAGIKVLGLLAGAPNRVALHPQAPGGYFASWNVPDAPGALDQWTDYVKQTVAHYRPYISYWEIWNEPYINGPTNAFFPNGTPEQYAELLKLASVAVRGTNSSATIVGVCSPGADGPWLEQALTVAGPQFFDRMSFHFYGNRLQGGPKTQIGESVEGLRLAQGRHGTAKPIWDSEGGSTDNLSWYVNETSAMRFQMSVMIRMDVAQLAAGVKKFFPYTMGSATAEGEAGFGMLEYDDSLKPMVAARAVLASLIDGASYVSRTEPQPGVEAHTFRQTDGSVVQVVWKFDATSHTLDVPKGMHALDILGNPIKTQTVPVGEEPLYFVGK